MQYWNAAAQRWNSVAGRASETPLCPDPQLRPDYLLHLHAKRAAKQGVYGARKRRRGEVVGGGGADSSKQDHVVLDIAAGVLEAGLRSEEGQEVEHSHHGEDEEVDHSHHVHSEDALHRAQEHEEHGEQEEKHDHHGVDAQERGNGEEEREDHHGEDEQGQQDASGCGWQHATEKSSNFWLMLGYWVSSNGIPRRAVMALLSLMLLFLGHADAASVSPVGINLVGNSFYKFRQAADHGQSDNFEHLAVCTKCSTVTTIEQ